MSPPDTTGGLGTSVDASELTEVADLDDLTDLMPRNLMLQIGIEQANASAGTRAAIESAHKNYGQLQQSTMYGILKR